MHTIGRLILWAVLAASLQRMPLFASETLPPNIQNIRTDGCTINLIPDDPEHPKAQHWHVDVFATYADGTKWALVYGIYSPKDVGKATAACLKWREKLNTEIKLKLKGKR